MGSASVARGAESQVSGMRLGNLLFQFGEIAVVMDNIVSSAYPLSTTDLGSHDCFNLFPRVAVPTAGPCDLQRFACIRSEEHTSELQSRENLVCRLLLEK